MVLGKIWFVWIGKKIEDAFNAVSYVARYTKRPPIAEGKILDYDGQNVTFTFVEHKTQKPECLTLSAEEFIKLLIRHIPDNNFRVVRYYGFLANRVRGKLLPKVFALLGDNYAKAKEKLLLLQSGSWWRRQLELFTRLDPLICSVCFIPLELVSVMYATATTLAPLQERIPMANIIVVKNMATALSEHDPFIWKCGSCGKDRKYTQKEIDKTKKPWPDPQNHERDYYVSCPFCQKGEMEPPTFISFFGAFNEK